MTKKLEIPLTDRRPVSIMIDDWPLLAGPDWRNGQHEYCLRVRQHADGRRLVYGAHIAPTGIRSVDAGYLVPAANGGVADEENTALAVKRVAQAIGDPALGDECLAEFPCEVLT